MKFLKLLLLLLAPLTSFSDVRLNRDLILIVDEAEVQYLLAKPVKVPANEMKEFREILMKILKNPLETRNSDRAEAALLTVNLKAQTADGKTVSVCSIGLLPETLVDGLNSFRKIESFCQKFADKPNYDELILTKDE